MGAEARPSIGALKLESGRPEKEKRGDRASNRLPAEDVLLVLRTLGRITEIGDRHLAARVAGGGNAEGLALVLDGLRQREGLLSAGNVGHEDDCETRLHVPASERETH